MRGHFSFAVLLRLLFPSLLLQSIICQSVAARTCYAPDGTYLGDVPCNITGTHSECCPVGTVCFSGGICALLHTEVFANGTFVRRASCTDPTWSRAECPKFCTESSWTNIRFCNTSTACCEYALAAGACSCQDGLGTFTLDIGHPFGATYVSATSTPSSGSLRHGAKAGIIIASVLSALILAVMSLVLFRKRRTNEIAMIPGSTRSRLRKTEEIISHAGKERREATSLMLSPPAQAGEHPGRGQEWGDAVRRSERESLLSETHFPPTPRIPDDSIQSLSRADDIEMHAYQPQREPVLEGFGSHSASPIRSLTALSQSPSINGSLPGEIEVSTRMDPSPHIMGNVTENLNTAVGVLGVAASVVAAAATIQANSTAREILKATKNGVNAIGAPVTDLDSTEGNHPDNSGSTSGPRSGISEEDAQGSQSAPTVQPGHGAFSISTSTNLDIVPALHCSTPDAPLDPSSVSSPQTGSWVAMSESSSKVFMQPLNLATSDADENTAELMSSTHPQTDRTTNSTKSSTSQLVSPIPTHANSSTGDVHTRASGTSSLFSGQSSQLPNPTATSRPALPTSSDGPISDSLSQDILVCPSIMISVSNAPPIPAVGGLRRTRSWPSRFFEDESFLITRFKFLRVPKTPRDPLDRGGSHSPPPGRTPEAPVAL